MTAYTDGYRICLIFQKSLLREELILGTFMQVHVVDQLSSLRLVW